jgi:hypothetical protein
VHLAGRQILVPATVIAEAGYLLGSRGGVGSEKAFLRSVASGEPIYDSWTRETDVEELARLRQVLVVMPEGGPVGWYSTWWNHGAGGPPALDTFHLRELRQVLESGYGAGTRRVIAGFVHGWIRGIVLRRAPTRHGQRSQGASSPTFASYLPRWLFTRSMSDRGRSTPPREPCMTAAAAITPRGRRRADHRLRPR